MKVQKMSQYNIWLIISKKNDNDLNFKDEEGEESLKMLGKKRKKSHNSEIDNDLDPLKGKDLIY